jgi:hypothetical protein
VYSTLLLCSEAAKDPKSLILICQVLDRRITEGRVSRWEGEKWPRERVGGAIRTFSILENSLFDLNLSLLVYFALGFGK